MAFFKGILGGLVLLIGLGSIGGMAAEPVLLSVSSSTNPVVAGQPVTLTATLRSVMRAPFGAIGLSAEGNSLGDHYIVGAREYNSLATGSVHTCALTSDGAVKCWGDNATYGQLGIGSFFNQTSPTDVSSLGTGNLSIVAGTSSTCVLTGGHAVKCWGDNSFGQLGQNDGLFQNSNIPIAVSGLGSGVASIFGGDSHFCALKSDGILVCWGRNADGQVGDGTIVNRDVPTTISGFGQPIYDVALGSRHSCALLEDSSIKCWGRGSSGQLGNGSNPIRSTMPTATNAVPDSALQIFAGGNTTCVINSTSKPYCWGAGTLGQIGDNGNVDRNTPTAVATVSTYSRLSLGSGHVCGLTEAGGVMCWGDGSARQLGRNGALTNEPSPEFVLNLTLGAASVAAGGQHSCALLFSGGLTCWGEGGSGQLGNGGTSDGDNPVSVATFNDVIVGIAVGTAQNCMNSSNGVVSCWGNDLYGTLGNGAGGNSLVPGLVTGGPSIPFIQISSSYDTSCGLTYAGSVYCWGRGEAGNIGNGASSNQNSPVAVTGLDGSGSAIAVATSGSHSCAVQSNGGAVCWGLQTNGRLGNGVSAATSVTTPVAVVGESAPYIDIVAGGAFTCGLTNGGAVECFGSNNVGQTGSGSSNLVVSAPAAVTGLSSDVKAIAAGEGHACAILDDRTVQCWGYNNYGQIGQSPTTVAQSLVPVAVSGLPAGAARLALGGKHSCALLVDGSVYCWGNNQAGQLGFTANSLANPSPTRVASLGTGVTSLAAGDLVTCALTENAGLKCFGYGLYGQLGNGSSTTSATPVSVTGTVSKAVVRSASLSGVTLGVGSHDIAATYLVGMVGERDVRFNAAASTKLVLNVTNQAPVLSAFSLVAVEDSQTAGTLAAVDPDGHSLTYSVQTSPSKGALTLSSTTGAYSYTPNGNGAQSDSFVVKVTDAFDASVTATASVTINGKSLSGGNQALIAIEDLPKIGQATISGGDSGDGITYSVKTAPSHGSLTVTAGTGAYVYTPNGNGLTSDSFVIRGIDVFGGTADVNVAVTITGLTVTGTDKGDKLFGGDAVDHIDGQGGNDLLDGKAGPDVMSGGKGDDIYVVDNSGDTLIEQHGQGFDQVRASVSFVLPAAVEGLLLTGNSAINGTGNSEANILTGNAAANILRGLAGNDKIEGRGGKDVLDGGLGRDLLVYGQSRKAVRVDLAKNKVSGGDGTGDRISGFEDVMGSGKADQITGNKGPNRLTGGKGGDILAGGRGKDVFVYLRTDDSKPAAPDLILDLSSAEKDLIDLSLIDANSKTKGKNEAFRYVGSAAFSKKPGELRFSNFLLEGDVSGDGKADLVIRLQGMSSLAKAQIKP